MLTVLYHVRKKTEFDKHPPKQIENVRKKERKIKTNRNRKRNSTRYPMTAGNFETGETQTFVFR